MPEAHKTLNSKLWCKSFINLKIIQYTFDMPKVFIEPRIAEEDADAGVFELAAEACLRQG